MTFAASWLALSLPPPHPPSKIAEIRQGLRHLLNLLKQSLMRKDLTTTIHRYAFTILTRNLVKSMGT
jgi:hypothetical protein